MDDLNSLDILDTPSEERFDLITRLSCATFDVPIALISLVDEDRQWFKSKQGLVASETSREISFCGHAILEEGPMVIEDTLKDERFRENCLVTGDPKIRFYAGAPLRGENGHRIGTLCLIDQKPRQLNGSVVSMLADLAGLAELELRAMRSGRAKLGPATRPAEERKELIDQATGTWKYEGLVELLEDALEECKDRKRPLTTFVFQPYGRADSSLDWSADQVEEATIAEIAQAIRRSAGDFDGIGRLDAEQFAVLMVGLDRAQAEEVSKSLQEKVNSVGSLRSAGVGLRVGFATVDPENRGLGAEALLASAVQSLGRAAA